MRLRASSATRRAIVGAVLASVAAAAVACDDPLTGNVERVGLPGLDFNLDPAPARGAAAGVAKASYNVSVDVTSPGADQFAPFGATGASRRYGATCPGLGANCWGFAPTVRDSTRDPRKPFLKQLPNAFSVNFCDIGGPEHFGATAAVQSFEVFCRFNGGGALTTPYNLSLVRYMTLVRGENDWVEKARTGTVTEPDTLIVMNFSPGGAPTVDYNWTSNLACNFLRAPAGANPFYLGSTTVTTGTRINFDKCFSSSGIFYGNPTVVVPDSAPVFRNFLGAPNIEQQYNYLEVREGATAGAGRAVARIQIGADIIYNGGLTRLQMAVVPLEPLTAGSQYKIVLVDRNAGTATPIQARYRRVTTDTTGRTTEGAYIIRVDTTPATVAGGINGGASNVTHLIEVDPALLPNGTSLTNFTDLALQPPSATKGVPVWAQFVLAKGATATTTTFQDVAPVQFGTLPLTPNATPYVFRAAGSASGTSRGDQLGISFSRLPRPPIGFYYNVWLLPADPAGAPVSAGPLRSPLPALTSLESADTAAIGGVLTSNQILDANLLLRPADVAALPAPLASYSRVRLTLEAKDGVPEMSSVLVLEGPIVTPTR